MEYTIRPLAHPSGLLFQSLVTVDPYGLWNVDVSRLKHEREVLENGLANCITYLCVLRKKYARNERQLTHDPLPPRKKRKKIQQSNRELSKEIKNRERDEQAFLSNLRACKANLYIAEGLPCTPTELSSTAADCASSATQYSFEEPRSTEMSWNGWGDTLDESPFGKQRSLVVPADEVAPDELDEDPQEGAIAARKTIRPVALHPNSTADGITAVCPRSSLSPSAAVFEPTIDNSPRVEPPAPRRIDKLNDLSWLETKFAEVEQAQRSKEADLIATSMRHLAIHPWQEFQRRGSLTWCNTSPQESPHKASSTNVGRDRTSSF